MGKAKVAGKTPQVEQLESGKTYAWCACGESAKQPWCDGSHQGSDFVPVVFKVDEAKAAHMCMCKQTNNPSYCDGSHMSIEK